MYTFKHREAKRNSGKPSSSRRDPWDSKKRNRRGFLRDSAALAGLAAGGAKLAKGQTQGTPSKKIEELIAYGERSRFVTSIYACPLPRGIRLMNSGSTFHVLTPLQDSSGIITPSGVEARGVKTAGLPLVRRRATGCAWARAENTTFRVVSRAGLGPATLFWGL